MLSISDAISKYSGEDDAYALKLKTGIRDAMGYSNYQAKLKGAVEAPISTGDVSKMDPATIARHRDSKMGIAQGEIDNLGKITDAIDTTAGGLASAQAAREKAAAKEKESQNIQYLLNPPNWAHQVINSVLANPYDQEGNLLTKEQIKEKLIQENNGIYGEQDPGMEKIDQNSFDQIIEERLGSDWEETYKTSRFEKLGFTESQAEERALYEQYSRGGMDENVMAVMEEKYPGWEKNYTAMKNQPGLSDALTPELTGDGSTVQAKLSFNDLKSQFSSVEEATLKKMAEPTYLSSLRGDIYKFHKDNGGGDKLEMEGRNKTFTLENLPKIQETTEYKQLVNGAILLYEGIFSDTEIKKEIDRAMISGNPMEYVDNFHKSGAETKQKSKDTLINDSSYRKSVWDILK